MRTHRKISPNPPAAAEKPAESEAARAARLEAKGLDMLARMGEIGMRFIERLDKRASGEMDEAEQKAFSRVGDDCNAFVKMSRSVRHIIVLEHEIAGLRAMPIPRAANGARAANGNAAIPQASDDTTSNDEASNDTQDRTSHDRPSRERRDYDHPYFEGCDNYRDYLHGPFMKRITAVSKAIARDLAGTEWEEDVRLAPHRARLSRFATITPHPEQDACLAEMTCVQRGELYAFGLGEGPPPELSVVRLPRINTS